MTRNTPGDWSQDQADDVFEQRIDVPVEYPVCFTRHLFAPRHALFENILNRKREPHRHRAIVYIDSGVVEARPELAGSIRDYFAAAALQGLLANGPSGGGPGWNQATAELAFQLGDAMLRAR